MCLRTSDSIPYPQFEYLALCSDLLPVHQNAFLQDHVDTMDACSVLPRYTNGPGAKGIERDC